MATTATKKTAATVSKNTTTAATEAKKEKKITMNATPVTEAVAENPGTPVVTASGNNYTIKAFAERLAVDYGTAHGIMKFLVKNGTAKKATIKTEKSTKKGKRAATYTLSSNQLNIKLF